MDRAGEIARAANESRTARRLKEDDRLDVVSNGASTPESTTIQGPARLGRVPVVQAEHDRIDAARIRAAMGGSAGLDSVTRR